MEFYTFSLKQVARSARDFAKAQGYKTNLIRIADGWLLMAFA